MGPEQSLIYIPDIDKWEKWEQNIYKLVMNIDFALIDGTFFSQDELPHEIWMRYHIHLLSKA